jgi:hypothetical protein
MSSLPDSLFGDSVVPTHPAYKSIRDSESEVAQRAKSFCNSLWERYRAICKDENFLSDIPHQFDQRFWEMYLGCWLIDLPYNVMNMPEGPDFLLTDASGKRIWIEAVCPTPGEQGHPDAVPEIPRGESFGVPDEKIVLRLTSVIKDKNEKYMKDLSKGLVGSDDAFILAINTKQVYLDPNCGDLPRLIKAVYPVGSMYFEISNVPDVPPRSGRWARNAISKNNQTEIPVGNFLDQNYAGITAILGCSIDCANYRERPEDNFFWIKNLKACTEIPNDLVRSGQKIYSLAIEEYGDRGTAYRVYCEDAV